MTNIYHYEYKEETITRLEEELVVTKAELIKANRVIIELWASLIACQEANDEFAMEMMGLLEDEDV